MNAVTPLDAAAVMERVLLGGDISKLDAKGRLFYYQKVCESVGLNPLTRPFDYLNLNGKTVLYAKRDATDQLRKVHGVSVTIKARENLDSVYAVTANARDKSGREDESIGAVNIQGLKGDALANALMKAETKAKRRVTLSICGLGMLDETEVEAIPNARIDPPAGSPDEPPIEVTPEGTPLGEEFIPSGKWQGKKWEEVSSDYLSAIVRKKRGDEDFQALCQKELDKRAQAMDGPMLSGEENLEETDDDIPF